ncbi:30S ribosomal protein S12 methylthiotransferase accessory protein YcaO [Prodigiosinella confusarubida]|uniref:30S ribosomal protein S12 methylthiotransferase accessory protein YcaO n=1 Tax=Serratia sp. (strain ATCC 39006) TaxID=104623 RepID=A0A2I5T985_SERS3|nr:30S ribosomal protein S12 methylthiotransferase accessory factor YcaO [Serratia sp. ATCC 39006]AUH01140.1 30S ribosomal protein S12 methylthiotransferase accessory protein YcaO [Serratia sp. ATCC 39006]AUH05461.1 30S ribosomal protein S12 methylthiotransferase accessory protein YcaO [Serratia sp. ATCC 39006]
MTQTFIPGKDAALEDSIARFQQQLLNLGFNIEEASWLNPVPNVWSVHIRDRDCALCFTNGKGATKKAALASALGEYFERLSTNYFFADFYLGKEIAEGDFVHYPDEKWFVLPEDDTLPDGILDARLRAFYDPEHELAASDLIDLQSGNAARGICALPFTRQSDQQTIYIPMNIIGNLYVSNGMSAGNTANEARVQALSEVFERYVKNRIIAESISLPEIPSAVLARYPTVIEAIAALEKEGFPIFAYDASLGGQYPVICVVLFNPDNGTCFASFGAHPDFGVALERTVTELLQGRSLKDLDVFTPPTFDSDEVAEHTNLETHFIDSSGLISWDMFRQKADYAFADWDFSGTTEQEFATLMSIFRKENKEVYIADYEHLAVYACRILVPGMSDIYPAEDLWLANSSMGAHLRDTLLTLPDSQWEPQNYLELLQQLDDEGLDDFTRVRELLGIASGKDNGWFTLRIGELKAMLALAGGDLDLALSWVEWSQDFNQSVFSAERSNYYRCLRTLLQLALEPERDPAQYYDAFVKMYGQDTVDVASAAIAGEQCFHGLFAIDAELKALPAHQSLLAAYEKLQQVKRKHWQKQ